MPGEAELACCGDRGSLALARYQEFLRLMEPANGDRPEIVVARAFVGR